MYSVWWDFIAISFLFLVLFCSCSNHSWERAKCDTMYKNCRARKLKLLHNVYSFNDFFSFFRALSLFLLQFLIPFLCHSIFKSYDNNNNKTFFMNIHFSPCSWVSVTCVCVKIQHKKKLVIINFAYFVRECVCCVCNLIFINRINFCLKLLYVCMCWRSFAHQFWNETRLNDNKRKKFKYDFL